MITFDHVDKSFGGRAALDDVSLEIDEGEFCVLVGPSGAGKSTALRLVNRLIEPDSGVVRVAGDDIAKLDAVTLRRRLGYVIQSIGLFPHWTVAENIATVPRLLGWPRRRIDERIDELLTLLALDPASFRTRMPRQLSGGQQQRVGVARALAGDPEILLMDEPFGALDAVTREALQAEMTRIHETTGKTIVMVTHDVDEAIRLASRIVVMEAGRIVQNARPEEILLSPASSFVESLFGGEAASLRLLKIRRVGDIVVTNGAAPDEAIAPDATLETALARMLVKQIDTLGVVDPSEGKKGIIRLRDVLRRAH
jgi:osmoprotectant transport system ATP-binding protein